MSAVRDTLHYRLRSLRSVYWDARHTPTTIFEREWDTLLLLDACRADVFRECYDGDAETRITPASSTPEFLRETFGDGTYHDLVYVTANPQPLRHVAEADGQPFHATVSVLDEWDRETQTVPPEAVAAAARRAASEYPGKRLLVHFLQPHAPFLGPTAARIRDRHDLTIGGVDPGREYTDRDPEGIERTRYEDALAAGIRPATVRQAYRETLDRVLGVVDGLAPTLEGCVALTADHGELLGERLYPGGPREWEHPSGVRTAALCRVPWVLLSPGPRRRTVADAPTDEPATAHVETRLRALGYQ